MRPVDGIVVSEGPNLAERERKAIQTAVHSIVNTERFYDVPTEVAGELLIGYLRSAKRKISRRTGVQMLLEDLSTITDALRNKVFQLANLNEARGVVLLHLSVAVGVEKVLKNTELWRSLKAEDYDAAHDALLQMYWSFEVVPRDDRGGQRRILSLARMMRTGALNGAPAA